MNYTNVYVQKKNDHSCHTVENISVTLHRGHTRDLHVTYLEDTMDRNWVHMEKLVKKNKKTTSLNTLESLCLKVGDFKNIQAVDHLHHLVNKHQEPRYGHG